MRECVLKLPSNNSMCENAFCIREKHTICLQGNMIWCITISSGEVRSTTVTSGTDVVSIFQAVPTTEKD